MNQVREIETSMLIDVLEQFWPKCGAYLADFVDYSRFSALDQSKGYIAVKAIASDRISYVRLSLHG